MALDYLETFNSKAPKNMCLGDKLYKLVDIWSKSEEKALEARELSIYSALGFVQDAKLTEALLSTGVIETGSAEKPVFKQEFLDNVLKDIPMPDWEIQETLLGTYPNCPNTFTRTVKTRWGMEFAERLHFLAHPEMYSSLVYGFIPTSLLAAASQKTFKTIAMDFIATHPKFVAENLLAMGKYSDSVSSDIDLEINSDSIRNIIHGKDLEGETFTSSTLEKYLKKVQDNIKIAKALEALGATEEDRYNILIERFLKWIPTRAAKYMFSTEGELAYLSQSYLKGEFS